MKIVVLILVFSFLNIYSNEMITFTKTNTHVIKDFSIYNNNYYIVGDNFITSSEFSWKSFYINYSNNQINDYKLFTDFGRAFYTCIDIDENENKYILNLAVADNRQDDIVLKKLDKNDNIVASYMFGEYSSDDEFFIVKYYRNNVYLFGSSSSGLVIIKLDIDLNQVWAKEYRYNNVFFTESCYFDDDKLIVVGWDRYNRGSNNYTLIQSVDLDGNILNSKIINFEKSNYEVRNSPDMVKIDGGYLFYLRKYQDVNIDPYIVRLDNNLEVKEILDFNFNNFEPEPIMAEDEDFIYLVNSNSNLSYIHIFDKTNLNYIKSKYVTEINNYKLNRIFVENNKLQVSGIGNSYFFIVNSDLNNGCYYKDTILNVTLTDIKTFSLINESGIAVKVNYEFEKPYSFSNEHEIGFEYSTCFEPSPCGDGSFFETITSSIDDFTLLNATETTEGSFLMTREEEYFSSGSLIHNDPVYVTAGFETEFAFKVSDGFNDFNDGSIPGADGFTLLFSEEPIYNFKDEQLGGGLGYHRRKNGIALEIDLYKNNEFNDPNGNHIALQRKGDRDLYAIHNEENTLGINSDIVEIESDIDKTYFCKMTYENRKLQVWIDESKDYETPAIEIENFEFSDKLDLVDNTKLFVSLSAVTGTSYQRQEVVYWDWCSSFDPMSNVNVKTPNSEIKIYPNPSSDMIYIEGITPNEDIEIFDITGRNVLIQKYNDGLNISDLHRGIYLIKINNVYYKVTKE